MISSFHIRNYKCLHDVSVELGPFTVLIGPNDSGKTSLLEAIEDLGRMAKQDASEVYSGPRTVANIRWRRKSELRVAWNVEGRAGNDSFVYRLELDPEKWIVSEEIDGYRGSRLTRDHTHTVTSELPNGAEIWHTDSSTTALEVASRMRESVFVELGQHLATTGRYRLNPSALRSHALPMDGVMLSSSGDNLAAVLDAILAGPDRDAAIGLERDLAKAIPTLHGLALRPVKGDVQSRGKKEIEFTLAGPERPRIRIPATLASDGALLTTAFLALAHGDTPGIVLIEEPENGMHPARLRETVELLRHMANGQVGNRVRQVVMTTHSPLVLNYVEPHEIRIVTRDLDADGATRVHALSSLQGISEYLHEFAPGELWYLLGEHGLLKGETP